MKKKPVKKKVKKTYDMNKGNIRCTMSMGRTINTGNYNSVRLDAGLSRDLQRGETTEECFKKIDEFLSKCLDKQADEHKIIAVDE